MGVYSLSVTSQVTVLPAIRAVQEWAWLSYQKLSIIRFTRVGAKSSKIELLGFLFCFESSLTRQGVYLLPTLIHSGVKEMLCLGRSL